MKKEDTGCSAPDREAPIMLAATLNFPVNTLTPMNDKAAKDGKRRSATISPRRFGRVNCFPPSFIADSM